MLPPVLETESEPLERQKEQRLQAVALLLGLAAEVQLESEVQLADLLQQAGK